MSTATTIAPKRLVDVITFLSKSPLTGFVGGQGLPASNGETFITRDPGTGEALAEVHNMQAADVDRAVGAAQDAFGNSSWTGLTPNERGVLLHRLADHVDQRRGTIAQLESIDCGKILQQADADVQMFIDTMRFFADLAQHVQIRNTLAVKGHEAWTVRQPWGPCAFIIPWNFPFLLLGWGIGPALAAGNTVVVKPAEDTPLSTLYLAQLAHECGFPAGVINVVPGFGETAGAALARHPRIKHMQFTGSPEVGRIVAQACAGNFVPTKLELGGKGAAVILDDVDVDDTAAKLAAAITFHTGQVCCDATRWLVHKNIYDKFVAAAGQQLSHVRIGYQLDEATQMGPVVSAKQQQRIVNYLKRSVSEGADVVLPGGLAEIPGRAGFYVKPALLSGTLNNVAAQEEIFGPVAYLAPFESEEEAIRMTNETDYGLANSVWSSDVPRASRVAEQLCAGNSWINAHNVVPLGVPYGGINKSGMGGGVNSVDTLFDYWRSLSVVRPL